MNNGWVKLHRKLLDKDWLKHDHSMFIVFSWLLLTVDRQTGIYTLGRFYCKEVGMKPSTFWMTLQRLVRCGAIDIQSNNKYSVVKIVKWENYQSIENQDDNKDDNKMTTKQQQDDTKQEVRIENKEKNKIIIKKNYGSIENLEEKDFEEIAQKYQVPLSFVKSKFDDMEIWAGSMPNNKKIKNRNWRLTLMGFVKRDAIQLRKEASYGNSKRGIDASGV